VGTGTVEKSSQLEIDSFVATATKGGSEFASLQAPPRITPLDAQGRAVVVDDLAADERDDPLLASKRWVKETAL
jgi:hypothetical protein